MTMTMTKICSHELTNQIAAIYSDWTPWAERLRQRRVRTINTRRIAGCGAHPGH